MSWIARHEELSASCLRTFKEDIVVRIAAGTHFVGGLDPHTYFSDGPKRVGNFALAPLAAGASNHLFILRINVAADTKLGGGARDCQHQYLGWLSLRLEQSRNQNVRVDDTRIIDPRPD